MPRRNEKSDIPTAFREWPSWLNELPPAQIKGKPNPDHYRCLLDRLNLQALVDVGPGSTLPHGYDSLRRGIVDAAKMAGIDEAALNDRRSAIDKAHDLVTAMREMPESVFEHADEVVSAVEQTMNEADQAVLDAVTELRETGNAGTTRAADWDARKKAWSSLLSRVRTLRQRARKPIPRRNEHMPDHDLVQGAAHVLRFMAYVGRSDIDGKTFRFARHHGHMAVAIYCVQNKVEVHPRKGTITGMATEECDLILPPRHGKTEIGIHETLLAIGLDPMTQQLIGHAQSKMAEDILGKIASYFDTENANGRRYLSLFPAKLADYDNNAHSLRVQLANPPKAPTIRAYGMTSRISGGNANRIWFDDPCDQDIADQPVQRDRVFNRMNGTWLRRLQGKKTFVLTTSTLWHQDDPVSRRLHQTASDMRQKRKITRKIVRLKCGGPSDKPPFKPLWPELYPEAFLRRVYKEMANPSLYSAVYRCDPMAEEAKLIKRLRFYDPTSVQHADFMRSAIKRLSLDPAATREQHNDRAGALLLANGEIRSVEKDAAGGEVVSFEHRVRILEAKEIHATQSDLVEASYTYCVEKRVDYIHVETRGGYVGTAEMFKNQYDIDVIRHDPTNAQKGDRLKAAAPAIEDANAASGIRAVVEFPGRQLPDGSWEPLDEFAWLCKQILEFGYHKGDHSVDALTQVILYLAPDIGIGLSARIQRQVHHDDSKVNRLALIFKAQREQAEWESSKTGNPNMEEYAWCRSNQL